MSLEKRLAIQEKTIRGLLIGMWAPREPQIMGILREALRNKAHFTQKTVVGILDRIAGMKVYTAVATCDEMVEFIKNLPANYKIVKGPCACRINTAKEAGNDARDIKKGNLDFCRESPLNLDIQFGKCGEKFGECEGYRPITKEECIALEYECRDMGLVSNLYVMFGGEGSICHCSSRTCVPLITHHLSGGRLRRFYQKGEYIALTDLRACCQNGRCALVCHFGARELHQHNLVFHADICYGCGLCAEVCPEKAITLVHRGTKSAIL